MSKAPTRILVVEDDASILQGLELALRREGHQVVTAEDGTRGLNLARQESWDLVVLDVMLPGRNGFEIIAAVRQAGIDIPVLMLSARSAEMDRIMGLDLGADDYVTKPFSVAEFLARTRALLRRRPAAATQTVLSFGDVNVDTGAHRVLKAGRPVELTASEYQVLLLLVRAGGRVLSRERILEAVHGPGHHGSLRTVDNFVAQLRAKLEDDPARPTLIETVRSFGYRIASS